MNKIFIVRQIAPVLQNVADHESFKFLLPEGLKLRGIAAFSTAIHNKVFESDNKQNVELSICFNKKDYHKFLLPLQNYDSVDYQYNDTQKVRYFDCVSKIEGEVSGYVKNLMQVIKHTDEDGDIVLEFDVKLILICEKDAS